MEILLECLFELAIEGTMELGTNIKVPKVIRYPVLVLILLFFAGVIVGMFVLGVVLWKDDLFFGILMMILGMFFLVGTIVSAYRFYQQKKSGMQ